MKKIFFPIVLFIMVAISCKDDSDSRLKDIARNDKKNEQIFAKINKAWDLNTPTISQDVQNTINGWAEWRLFTTELEQKPKSSIGAFKQKAKTLSRKANDLNNNIPAKFDNPEIRARIMTLSTKVKSMDLFINLDKIEEEKVLKLIPEINSEMVSLTSQMEKLIKKSQIRLEEGEAEMLRSLGKDSLKSPEVKLPTNSSSDPNFNPHQNPKAQR